MPDPSILEISGAQTPDNKYSSLATLKFIGGLQSQRSPFASIDTRYNSRYLGGKPDALIAGSNVELSNKLTLQRRPGLLPYGPSIPPPLAFFEWQQAAPPNIQIIVDTQAAIYNYSTSSAGILLNKNPLAGRTNFYDLVNTLYMGDGEDLYKCIGPNLLIYSNTLTASNWTSANATFTPNQADPLGGMAATLVTWGTSGTSATINQTVVPNYTPVASNTFTFSAYLMATSAMTLHLAIQDQAGNSIVDTAMSVTTAWTRFQVTGTMGATATGIKAIIYDPSATTATTVYAPQLEVGGPATPAQITTNQPQGVYLWGIQAPTTAPIAVASSLPLGTPWAPNTAYSASALQLTSVASSTGVYTGTITGGGSNAFAGYTFQILGFVNSANNGSFVCTASNTTTLTLLNTNSIAESHAATATPQFSISSVAANGVYTGIINGGGSNAYAGYGFRISGFSDPENNGNFYCTASTTTTLTLLNFISIAETTHATALALGQAVTDSNGNLQTAITSGTSGATALSWATAIGATTQDSGSVVIQQAVNFTTSSSVAIPFPNSTTSGNSLLAFTIAVSPSGGGGGYGTVTDTLSNTWVPITEIVTSGLYTIVMWYVISNGSTSADTVTYTSGSSDFTWMGILETNHFSSVTGWSGNSASNSSSAAFNTGSLSVPTVPNLLVTFAAFVNGTSAANEIGTPPAGYVTLVYESGMQPAVLVNNFVNAGASALTITVAQTVNPQWTISSLATSNRLLGITASFQSTIGTLEWINQGPIGLSSFSGTYQYYYAFMNSQTGHVSNVSPVSGTITAVVGNAIDVSGQGMQITPSGPYSQDPQVDTIALYRNKAGGAFWFQLTTFPNPGTTTSPGTWTYQDTVPDDFLNTDIYAPIGLLNTPPPAGAVNPEFYANRLFVSVGNLLYYATSADNAALLNIVENGVSAESFAPANVIPFNAPITRSLTTAIGLLVFTTTDIWLINGTTLANFSPPTNLFPGHGLLSYNALDIDGSSLMIQTADKQNLIINPSSGAVESGFPIGDLLEQLNPEDVYIARHIAGSQDNAFYVADGSTGWYRLNPNQVGASVSGEQTPVWSPFATIEGGAGAIASIEVSPGNRKLLVGQAALTSNITALTYSNNGSVTFIGNNSFTMGQHVTITGISLLNGVFNISGNITSANSTSFTLNITGLVPTVGFNVTATNASPTSISWSNIPVEPGDVVVVSGSVKGTGATISNITDSLGTTYNTIASSSDSAQGTLLAISNPIGVSATLTVTMNTSSSTNNYISIVTIHGSSSTNFTGATVSSSPGHSGNLTTATTNNLIIGLAAMFGSGSVTPSDSLVKITGFSSVGISQENVLTNSTSVSSSWSQGSFVSHGSVGVIIFEPQVFSSTPVTGFASTTGPVLYRDLDTFSDNGTDYSWSATIGSIMLATPGKLANLESITTELNNTSATQPGVAVLLDEISGSFENLPNSNNDPPQLATSTSVLSNRFYLSQGSTPPICRHTQLQLTGATATTKDEILAITFRGELVNEQI